MSTTIAETPVHVALTGQERNVLIFIAQGYTSKQVAEKLIISKRTVDFHLANIYEKLGAHNRVQAIRLATDRGLLARGGGLL